MLFIRDSWLTMRRSSERFLTLMAALSQKNTSEQALIALRSCESASLDKIESRVPYTVCFLLLNIDKRPSLRLAQCQLWCSHSTRIHVYTLDFGDCLHPARTKLCELGLF